MPRSPVRGAAMSTARRRSLVTVDLGRATHPARGGSGSVITMHPRRTTTFILAALLTSGCVAVPHSHSPVRPARPAGLAPATDRPPAPGPTGPKPTPAAPREELTTTGPRSGPKPAKTGAPAPAAPAERTQARPDTAQSERRTQPRKRPATTKVKAKRKSPKPSKVATRKTVPKVHVPKKQVPKKQQRPAPRRQRPAVGQALDMRQLCREAGRINAPMGAADLCRSMYDR
ncbi:hypothetical protein [Streptomyces sp. NPDC058671]|uniref:hypothetical protein n=1 Tax=Streptomyces sp. NPDC058671 TaxID=3346590 RepID=UPI0036479345